MCLSDPSSDSPITRRLKRIEEIACLLCAECSPLLRASFAPRWMFLLPCCRGMDEATLARVRLVLQPGFVLSLAICQQKNSRCVGPLVPQDLSHCLQKDADLI